MKPTPDKTILEISRLCPNGLVGERITITVSLSDWYWNLTTDTTEVSDQQLKKVERVVEQALNKIEKALAIDKR